MAGFVPLKNLKLQLQERDFPNLVSSLPYKKKKKVYWLDMQDLEISIKISIFCYCRNAAF
jgi:hypothetical protein